MKKIVKKVLVVLLILNFTFLLCSCNEYLSSPNDSTEDYPIRNSGTVYITPTGKKYHYFKSCAGMNAVEVKKDSDLIYLYEPCKKCTQYS